MCTTPMVELLQEDMYVWDDIGKMSEKKSSSWWRISTRPILGPNLPVTLSLVLNISKEPNLKRIHTLTWTCVQMGPTCTYVLLIAQTDIQYNNFEV